MLATFCNSFRPTRLPIFGSSPWKGQIEAWLKTRFQDAAIGRAGTAMSTTTHFYVVENATLE